MNHGIHERKRILVLLLLLILVVLVVMVTLDFLMMIQELAIKLGHEVGQERRRGRRRRQDRSLIPRRRAD